MSLGTLKAKDLHNQGVNKGEVIKVANIDDVLSWKWTGKRLLEDLIRTHYENMEGLDSEHEGNAEQWAPVFMDNPDT